MVLLALFLLVVMVQDHYLGKQALDPDQLGMDLYLQISFFFKRPWLVLWIRN